MTTINKTALVPYSASEMYALVNDIDSYAHFLPWCRSTQILQQDEDQIRATIEIAHGSRERILHCIENALVGRELGELRRLGARLCRLLRIHRNRLGGVVDAALHPSHECAREQKNRARKSALLSRLSGPHR